MAWEDRTPFEAIQYQFNLKEKEVIHLMRSELKSSSFKMWRKRVSGRNLKHGFPNFKTKVKSPKQKWKSNWQKNVQNVKDISSGEKNGLGTGKMSFTAQKDAEKENIEFNNFVNRHTKNKIVKVFFFSKWKKY